MFHTTVSVVGAVTGVRVTSARPAFAYNPSLDGVRAGAVTAVVFVHAGFHIDSGYGVTLFFVLSGYLITGLLLLERESTGAVDLRSFYRRRFARLAPALLVITAVTVAWLLIARTPVRSWFAGPLGVLTYSANIIDLTGWKHAVGGFWSWAWSLSVEEQFYFVWPALLLVVFRARGGQRSRQRFAAVAAMTIAAAWVSRAQMAASYASYVRVKVSFDSNTDALAWGALIAIAAAGRSVPPIVRRAAGLVALLAALAFAVEVVHPQIPRGLLGFDANGQGVVAITCALLVAGLVLAPGSLSGRVLASKPAVHLGRLSYGIYLWNEFCWHIDKDLLHRPPRSNVVGMIATLAVLLLICELSYRLVEVPLRRRLGRRRTPGESQPRPVLASVS